MKYTVYPVGLNSDGSEKGLYAPNYYLHGQAQDDNGYDIMNVNKKLMQVLLKTSVCIADNYNEQEPMLVISFYSKTHSRMKGYAVYLKDTEAVDWALDKARDHGVRTVSVYEDHKMKLKNEYPIVWELIKSLHD